MNTNNKYFIIIKLSSIFKYINSLNIIHINTTIYFTILTSIFRLSL